MVVEESAEVFPLQNGQDCEDSEEVMEQNVTVDVGSWVESDPFHATHINFIK
jgi:uncharacterized protein YciI